MSSSDEEIAKRIAHSEALQNQVRNTQQASLFLSEVAKMRCHTSQDDLQQRSASLVQQSTTALRKSQELRRRLSRKQGNHAEIPPAA